MIRLIFFIALKFILGAESGASLPWSKKWQSKTIAGHALSQLPEIVDSVLMGLIVMQGYDALGLDVAFHWEGLIFLAATAIMYAGVQSATWMFLQWEGHSDPDTDRDASTKPIVDKIAERFGWKLGDEGYSWVAATVKGGIMTLPMGGLGGIFFALGYEIGSHAYGRVDKWINPHIISEGLSFAGIALYAALFLEVCKMM